MKCGFVARLLSRSAVVAVPIVLLLATGVGRADAQSSDAPVCDPADQANITAALTADGQATFTVNNTLPLCDPVPIGVAVYLKDANGLVFPQSLADSVADTITSGSKQLTVAIPQSGTHPTCFTQIDAFTGAVLPQITETEQYGDRLLAYLFGEVPNCAQVEGESTSTSSSSTTTTSTTTSTTTKNGNTSTVEAVAVTRSSGPPSQPTALPRTGPAVNVQPLVTGSGLLLMIGGTLIAMGQRRPRRHVS